MARDVTTSYEYKQMPPNESIVGLKGFSKALLILYGPNWESTEYDPLFNNIRTGALMSKPHHCTYNDAKGHKMNRRCVTDGHQGYCIEFVTEKGRRVRCGQRLKVESGGCGTHSARKMANSKNLLIKNMVAGKLDLIIWDQLNDSEQKNEGSESSSAPTAKQLIQQRENEKLAELDEKQDVVEDLPANSAAYNPHIAFVEHKRAQERSMAEERKMNAAAKRSGVLGTMKQAAAKLKMTFADEPGNPLDKKARQGKSYKTTQKGRKLDPDTFKNKRGGKNAGGSDSSGQENRTLGRK